MGIFIQAYRVPLYYIKCGIILSLHPVLQLKNIYLYFHFTVAEMTLLNKWHTTCYLLAAVSILMVACESNLEVEKDADDRKGKGEYPK